MESEILSQNLEWEARRVATAFGVEELRGEITEEGSYFEEVSNRGVLEFLFAPEWFFVKQYDTSHHDDAPFQVRNIIYIRNDQPQEGWIMVEDDSFWSFVSRGLYRLGFENKELLAQLPKLTAHEKLELRLSLPREFWPPQWCEQEAGQAANE